MKNSVLASHRQKTSGVALTLALSSLILLFSRPLFVAAQTTGSIAIVSPSNGSTVSGSVTVSIASTLSVNDDWWNSLAVDGVSTSSNDSGHYQKIIWNSALPSGTHTLTITAHQMTTGTVTATASVSVVVGTPGDMTSLGVMTYNADEGTNLLQVETATTQEQFQIAIGNAITQVRATNPPARMKAVAEQIIAAAPTIVSLQELDQWSTGPFDPVSGACGATSVEFNMVQELLDALNTEGGHYALAVEGQASTLPPTPGLILPSTYLCVATVNYNAILVRTDLNSSQFQWSNPQAARFASEVVLSTPEGDIPIPRGWVSIDASFEQQPFRVIGSHLEVNSVSIRQSQGAELRAVPANTTLPVIVAMDSNAQAFPLPHDAAYADFMTAGYIDAWSSLLPTFPGLTCCQAALVDNTVSQLWERVDQVLTLGSVHAQQATLFGVDPASKTPDGLWPSDHAAVAAQLTLAN